MININELKTDLYKYYQPNNFYMLLFEEFNNHLQDNKLIELNNYSYLIDDFYINKNIAYINYINDNLLKYNILILDENVQINNNLFDYNDIDEFYKNFYKLINKYNYIHYKKLYNNKEIFIIHENNIFYKIYIENNEIYLITIEDNLELNEYLCLNDNGLKYSFGKIYNNELDRLITILKYIDDKNNFINILSKLKEF